jgi:prophage regulatory protein
MDDNSAPWRDIEPTGRLLRPTKVVETVGLSRSQVYQMISEGRFPPFIKLSDRASAMPEAWLDAFVQQRARLSLKMGETK